MGTYTVLSTPTPTSSPQYTILSGGAAPAWTPASLPGLVAWYRSDAANVTLVSGNVSAWVDLSGNGNTAVQSNPTYQPAYSASGGANGRPYLIGSSLSLLVAAGVVGLSQPLEWIAIVRTGATVSGDIADLGLNNNVTAALATTTLTQYSGSLGSTITVPDSTDIFVDSLFDGAGSQLSYNNATPNSADPGAGSPSTMLTLMNYGGGGGFGWTGWLYEFFLVSGAISSSDRTAAKAYSTSLYGVP